MNSKEDICETAVKMCIRDRVVFEDMALYTMVKTNTFNGMALPSIVWRDESGRENLVKSFGYEDFKGRLS